MRTDRPFPSAALHRWCRLGVLAALLLGNPARPQAEPEDPPEPFEEIEAFDAGPARGVLVLPGGAPDRVTPAVVILDNERGEGHGSPYRDRMLGAGLAVLDIRHRQGDPLDAVLEALAAHPRIARQPIGVLALDQGASLAALRAGRVAALALLHRGCSAPAAAGSQAAAEDAIAQVSGFFAAVLAGQAQ
ncbi:hypothetical protein [Roseomonas sp. AR75]|uniref:hypothetical protein n=1 Tax=Roseomonas sp. AR75 TaxID=2562311 RepID=UPI0010C0A105|nr:hypothetical protein [Roseomonas sp. AR75]